MTVATALRVAAAVAGFLVLPGLLWSQLLDGTDRVEQAGLSVGLSVALLVVVLSGLQILAGVEMTLTVGVAVAAALVLVPGGLLVARRVQAP